MNYRITIFLCLLTVAILPGCKSFAQESNPEEIKIAFMADVHFHDVFAEFEDDSFDGLPTEYQGEVKSAAIRTMESQLTSTRLFNENYFAFIAALDDVVDRGIKLVGFPGDFSDDGQPVHLRGFSKILDDYKEKYGIQFFIAPGNHDPGRPFARDTGKTNYLGENGRPQPIFSNQHPYCTNAANRSNPGSNPSRPQPHDVICTDEVIEFGYEEILGMLGSHGLYPDETYLYYETPFSSYDQSNYMFDQAKNEANYSARLHEICHEGSGGEFREPHYTNCFDIMDMSYVVEPVEGLWLLSIDANVYVPVVNADKENPESPANFSPSGNAGYNYVLSHKQHLLPWIMDVAKRAEENDKTLIAFSHYPAIDFYNQAQDKIEELWGEGRFQVRRIPSKETSMALAATGLKIHVGGHMHMNNTAAVQDEKSGNNLFNIQVPSVASYVPAYKIFHIGENRNQVEVETVVLEEVPDFKTLFSHYPDEWKYLDSIGYERNWDREILETDNYYGFTNWHLSELSRLRFLPREWPGEVRIMLTGLNGREMLIASKLESSLTFEEFKTSVSDDRFEPENITPEFAKDWNDAEQKAASFAENAGINLSDFTGWNGVDFSIDFYRLRNADELALRDIPEERIKQYSLLASSLAKSEMKTAGTDIYHTRFDEVFKYKFRTIFEVLYKFSNRLPGDHFLIHLKTGEINNLAEVKQRLTIEESP